MKKILLSLISTIMFMPLSAQMTRAVDAVMVTEATKTTKTLDDYKTADNNKTKETNKVVERKITKTAETTKVAEADITAETTPMASVDAGTISDFVPDEMPAHPTSEKRLKAPSVMDISPSAAKDAKPTIKLSEQRVLLIGDSMCDGLGSRFADYAKKNGFDLHTVIWYGSKTSDWATKRDLEYHIERVRPTYIIISLGTNDLGFYDYDRREGWIKDILAKIGNIPYLWVGPLSWKKIRDRTLVDIIRRNTGERHFFDSTSTTCQRVDGIHPTFTAAARWVDAIASRLSNSSTVANPLVLERPDQKAIFRPDEKHTPRYKGRL